MLKRLKLIFHPSDAVVTSRWLEVSFIALWLIYGTWGAVSLIEGIPTIVDATLPWYQFVWAGAIGILGYTAALFALSTFFNLPPSPVMKKQIERAAVVALTAFIAIYPILLFVSVVLEGESHKLAVLILSLSYLVFPVLRVYLLTQKIKLYELD